MKPRFDSARPHGWIDRHGRFISANDQNGNPREIPAEFKKKVQIHLPPTPQTRNT